MVTKPTKISKFKFHSEYYSSVHANILWLQKHFAEVSGRNNMHILGYKYELDRTTVRNTRRCYLDVRYEFRSTKVEALVTFQPKCWTFSSAAHSNNVSAPSTRCLQSNSAIRTSGNCLWIFRTLNFPSWVKIGQLDVTYFIISLFNVQHVLNVSTSILRSLRLIVDLFHVLYCSGSMYVGLTVWFGWGGVVSLCRLKN
jgi:hypothetical protein